MGRGSSKAGGGSGAPKDEDIKEALDYYKQDGYYINNILRQGEALDSNEKEYIAILDRATSGNVEQDTLYRVVDASTVFTGMDDFEYADLKSHLLFGDSAYDKGAYSQNKKAKIESRIENSMGKTVTDKGYMSTTTSLETALHKTSDDTHGTNRVILKINGTKGAKGADMRYLDKKYSYLSKENEILLSRGNGYKYKKVYAKDGNIIVEAEFRRK